MESNFYQNNNNNTFNQSYQNIQKLPPGWEIGFDRSQGKYYYIDHNTRTTHWAPPIQQTQETFYPSPQFQTQKIIHSNNVPSSTLSVSNYQTSQKVTAPLSFLVNGQKVTIENPDPMDTLNLYLRSFPNYKGTKRTCGEGGCGACTVTLTHFDQTLNKEVTRSINSCLRPICSIDGMSVTTIEGLGSKKKGFHPVQERLADYNGTQCGFCSPGMVMNMYSLLQENPTPSSVEVERHFDGNLCRCTGYRPILTAMKTFSPDNDSLVCSNQSNVECCSKKELPDMEDYGLPKFEKYIPTNSPSKPLSLLPSSFSYSKFGINWYNPLTLSELYTLLNTLNGKKYRLVVGNTSTGIYKNEDPTELIYIGALSDLRVASLTNQGAILGGACTLTNMIALLRQWGTSSQYPKYQTQKFLTMVDHLEKVANVPVRNIASVAGNLMIAYNHNDFPSDVFTILLGSRASILVGSSQGQQSVPLSNFLQYDMTGKVILSIFIPFGQQNEFFQTYKVMARHVNSHAIINAAFSVVVDSNFRVSGQPIIAYAGIQGPAIRISTAETAMIGRSVIDQTTLQFVISILQAINPNPDAGKVAYRKSLILTLFYKFFLSMQPSLPSHLQSAVRTFKRPVSSGKQKFQTTPNEFPLSEPIPKLSGRIQTSGESVYVDDLPDPSGTLYAAFVLSTQANATIQSIDASLALKSPGVKHFFSASDLPINLVPQFFEEIFASKQVSYYGQAIGLILADTQNHANEAAKKVQIAYSNIQAPILSIADAIKNNSFWANSPAPISSGDVDKGFRESAYVLEGSTSSSHQAHFHMETHSVLCVPEENNTMHVYASTQCIALVQSSIAAITNKRSSDVIVEARRLGGGFGAKGSRNVIAHCGVAAVSDILGIPVKMAMDLTTNLTMIGKRHPFLCNYKVGIDKNGKTIALKLSLYLDQGAAEDVGSGSGTLEVAFTNIDNCYKFPNFYVEGKCCKTNTPPNTYTRAPGWAQSVLFVEHVMEHIATFLNKTPESIKALNFYSKGDVTPYGQVLNFWNIPRMWTELQNSIQYDKLVSSVNDFNSANRWNKRGISLIPVKFGVGWAGANMGSLVSIMSDGTVTVSTSGIEMGQGLNTKVCQAASYSLGVPMDLITIQVATTVTVPNAAGTGGSIGSELCVKTTIQACEILNERLAVIRKMIGPNASWQQIVHNALSSGIDLQAKGYVNPPPPKVGVYDYNTYGVSCVQSEIDVLTGEIQILSADILFDCGISMNPAIDIGQIEGGFIQGLGMHLSEEVLYDSNGRLLTDSTWEYKPFSALDIPISFNVTLLHDAPNPVGIQKSKAVGEPPLVLSCTGLYSIQHAVAAARKDIGKVGYFDFNSPCMCDQIHLLCLVEPSQFIIN